MTLDWLVYALGVVAVVFLVGMFFKYKKHNRYADKFEDTYPDINVNIKMYSFDHLRMYNFDHIDT